MKKRGIRKDQEDHFTFKRGKMTSPQDEETKMVKEKAGEEVSVKVEIPPVITKEKQERPGTESKTGAAVKKKGGAVLWTGRSLYRNLVGR